MRQKTPPPLALFTVSSILIILGLATGLRDSLTWLGLLNAASAVSMAKRAEKQEEA